MAYDNELYLECTNDNTLKYPCKTALYNSVHFGHTEMANNAIKKKNPRGKSCKFCITLRHTIPTEDK